jgi:hypothetical protein
MAAISSLTFARVGKPRTIEVVVTANRALCAIAEVAGSNPAQPTGDRQFCRRV